MLDRIGPLVLKGMSNRFKWRAHKTSYNSRSGLAKEGGKNLPLKKASNVEPMNVSWALVCTDQHTYVSNMAGSAKTEKRSLSCKTPVRHRNHHN